jgi:hypothetical protein
MYNITFYNDYNSESSARASSNWAGQNLNKFISYGNLNRIASMGIFAPDVNRLGAEFVAKKEGWNR